MDDKILIIPDVHLKGWMFEEADRLMKEHGIEQAVCLGDLVDDWDQQLNRQAYENVFDQLMAFDKKHPNTLWCYGNHDISYTWHKLESGYSPYQEAFVEDMMSQMRKRMQERLNFCHVMGQCMFTHAGVTWEFLDWLRYRGFKVRDIKSLEDVKNIVNQCSMLELWKDESPLWTRPYQGKLYRTFKDYDVLQVTGHTPVEKISIDEDRVMYCDVFSTYQDGEPIGPQEFPVISSNGTWIASLQGNIEKR